MKLRTLIAVAIGCMTAAIAHATVLLNEQFAYPDGALTNVSGGNWVAHSAAANKPILVSGQKITLEQSDGSGQDVSRYVGATQGAGDTWYAGFDVNVPSGASSTTYFAHFMVTNTGFFSARTFITSSTSGDYTLALSASSSTPYTNWPAGLSNGVTYRVIISYDYDSTDVKLWVDPSSEASPSILAPGTFQNANDLFAFRQSTGDSFQVIDNLLVGTTFADVLGGTNAAAPVITTDPQSQTVAEGYPALLSGAASGNPDPTYQWYKDGGSLGGETNTTLSIASAAFGDAGDYHFVAMNSQGSATSAVATLTVIAPQIPTITLDPVSQTRAVTQPVTFSGAATGIPDPTYQWLKDGAPVTGETAMDLTIASVVHTNAGDYRFVASSPGGSVTSAVATLTVVGFAMPIPNTNTFEGTTVIVPIPFFDNQSGITSVTAVSGQQGLLPNGNISSSGSGSNWSLSLTPVASTNGVAIVTVTAGDGSFTTNATFGLIVRPSSGVYFNDYFYYADGSLLTRGSNVWLNHSGTFGQSEVVSEQLALSGGLSEDVNAGLIGAPYSADSGKLYSKFTLYCLTLSSSFDGTYIAHFKDDGFNYRARVFTSTNGAAANTFRVGIGNNSTPGLVSYVASDLSAGVTYTVVTRFDTATGEATLWLNPTAETDPSVTDTNTLAAADLTAYAFREASFMGDYLVDGLVVGGSFDAVMSGAPIPIPLTIDRGGSVVVRWNGDPSFNLQAAPTLTGTYTNVPGATTPYTNPATASETYYRLYSP